MGLLCLTFDFPPDALGIWALSSESKKPLCTFPWDGESGSLVAGSGWGRWWSGVARDRIVSRRVVKHARFVTLGVPLEDKNRGLESS